jgi:HEPN domain-containing protein
MNVIDIVTEWFRFSNNDLLVAKQCYENFNPKQTEISCYHCQQCAEKALKGFLISKGISELPKIHNLEILCNDCKKFDNEFNKIYDFCSKLTPFASIARYPNELCPEEIMAKNAIKSAQKIYDFCFKKTEFGHKI